MRKAPGAITMMIMAIAVYFTLVWGFDAFRTFTSPTYGLDEVWHSQFVFALGRMLGASPDGLVKIAAVFGALKLIVAGVCAWHLMERVRSLFGRKSDTEILEAGLMLAVIASLAAAMPVVWAHNFDAAREQIIPLLLAALAAALCIIERFGAAPAVAAPANAKESARWFSPWR
ncbi:MAG TPA: hypothetical protein VHD14_03785 [Pseudolabrys sp.]|jgi:hypothetical protein|nr:hypothetical protein [Pseudolabrys sp.]